ncbi:MAG: DUF3536 domain-containing protein [Deltaproteobacteria bacterium]|nr:DUF3536 domain-containing protein [Deltaproteobacteria bacterium]
MDLPPSPTAQGIVVIHGHFYQPPRENPWIEEIEEEPGAHPYHDWNARITAECYRPNGWARIYDGRRRILEITNNYELISFNFGPTLASWLERKAPETYRRILEADRRSLERRGRGNAIAQAYNHAILPLASPRNRETEIIWGLKDFQHRFGRPAEALWLPETGVDYPTLADLVAHGLRYVILSPYQAKRVRPLSGGAWEPVQGHTLDTTQAYRCFLPGPAGEVIRPKYLDVFFYNGNVASDLSFGDLLQDSYRLVDRLAAGFNPELPRPQLLHVATDGENYGHHKKFGELALAHALVQVLPERGFTLTNYAAFLEGAPPRMRVELDLGADGRGSSWSCPHGVGRWMEDCGCSTGGPPTWNQRWRAPLREAFDFLDERLAAIFEAEGERYFRDPWAARNAYIDVILERRPEVLEEFFSRQGSPGLDPADWLPALRLLEMQRHALLMFTSCGWFFADLAGLETLQVMKYAARALQLGENFSREPLEEPFLRILEQAVSNQPEEGTGRRIYERRIRPAVVDFPKVVNQWAISWLKDRERQCPTRIYHYRVEPLDHEVASQASLVLASGRLRVTSGITRNIQHLSFYTVFLGSYLYRTQVQQDPDPQEFSALKQELFRVLEETPEDLIPLMARRLGERYYTVHDIFLEEKEQLFRDLLLPNHEDAVAAISHHFVEVAPLLKAMARERLPLPRLYRVMAEITLNRRLVEILRELAPHPTRLAESGDLRELVQEAGLLRLQFDSREGADHLGRMLRRHLEHLAAAFNLEAALHLSHFLSTVSGIPMTLDFTEAQNFIFDLAEQRFPDLARQAVGNPEARELAKILLHLLEALSISPVRYLKLMD